MTANASPTPSSILASIRSRKAQPSPIISGAPVGGIVPLNAVKNRPYNIQTMQNAFESSQGSEELNPYVTKYNAIDTTEDLIAISCTRHRLSQKDDLFLGSGLLAKELFELVTEEDRVKARNIRDHYNGKIVFWELKEKPLTPFRADLYQLINSDGKRFSEKMIPLAYRLPGFYDYDKAIEGITADVDKTLATTRSSDLTRQDVRELTPIGKTTKKNKRFDTIEYWLKDDHNQLCLMSLFPKNPLEFLWEKEFAKSKLVIDGYYVFKHRNDVPCFQILAWKIV